MNAHLAALEINSKSKPFEVDKTVIMYNIMQPPTESQVDLLSMIENIVSDSLELLEK